MSRFRRGEGERTLCGGEGHRLALLRRLAEVLADTALGVGRDRQLDQAVPGGGVVGHGVAAGVADAVDLDAELGVLTGAEAGPVARWGAASASRCAGWSAPRGPPWPGPRSRTTTGARARRSGRPRRGWRRR